MNQLLIAVHIADGVLVWPWLLGGFAGSGLVFVRSARRVRDDDLPRIGILTATFFVASLIHVRVGPTSVHLLLNSLVGVVLGPGAALAIGVGLLLQAVLIGHGGFTALGVNCLIITVPALLARGGFSALVRREADAPFRYRDGWLAVAYVLHPIVMAALAVVGVVGRRLGLGRDGDPDFRAGFVVGATCVVLTAALNAALLVVAGIEDWRAVAALVLLAHLPIAFVEGIIVGCAASFLRRVRPELLGESRAA